MVKIAFCTKDIDFQISTFEKTEGQKIELTSLRSTNSLFENVKTTFFDVVVLDEDVFKLENLNNVKSVTTKEILKYLNMHRRETIFLFISNSAKGFKNLEKVFENIFYFNKNEFEAHRFFKFISCCESFMFSPVMVSELPLKVKTSTNLYFSGHSQLSDKIFMKKDMLITSSFINTLKKKNIRHLYIRKSDLDIFYKNHSVEISREMHDIWESARVVLLKMLDDSGKFSTKHGNNIIKQVSEICEKIFELIKELNDSKSSFNLLLLPRYNEVNFAINNVILSAVLNQILSKRFDLDLGLAAFSYFHYINKNEEHSDKILFKLQSEQKLLKYQRHFREKLFLRTSKALKYYNLAFENLLGSGIPNSEILNIKEPEFEIIKVSSIIQELRLVHNGELERPIKNLFTEIKKIEKEINPKLYKVVDNLCRP